MLTQPARRTHLQVIREGWAPSPDNSAILCEVDVPIDVAVAVGDSVPMGLSCTLLSCGAGLILPINNQLNSLFSSNLSRREGVKVNFFFSSRRYNRRPSCSGTKIPY